jgi:hypothetical protein
VSHRLLTLLALVPLLAAEPSLAVDKCKVKQAKDGTLFVSATDVTGTLRFGYTADRVVTAISGATCIADGTALVSSKPAQPSAPPRDWSSHGVIGRG